jgi:hypothetical protein
MMSESLSRKRLYVFVFIFTSIVGFGLLLVSRFNATAITPATNAVEGAPEAGQTELLKPTDKTELVQTDLMAAEPSSEITAAEQAMPERGTWGYRSACQNMKLMYANERTEKLRAESGRFTAMQQEIINRYNRDGRSFSTAQKLAQAREARRHESIMKQITKQYQKQLKNLSC